jgi:hypothetical protein
MNFKPWDATIQQIADEANFKPNEAAQSKVLTAWRSKLEKEPTSLPPFQIDNIMREARKRFTAVSR